MTDTAEISPRPVRRMRFHRAGPKLSQESARRQGEVTHLAFLLLGGRDAAIEFLNNPDVGVGGRPIDVAIASAEGAATVTRAIRRLSEQSARDQ